MAIDISQIQPQQLQALGRMFGITSAEDLMQAIQQNPQIAQQVLGAIAAPTADADAGWIDARADDAMSASGSEWQPQPPNRMQLEQMRRQMQDENQFEQPPIQQQQFDNDQLGPPQYMGARRVAQADFKYDPESIHDEETQRQLFYNPDYTQRQRITTNPDGTPNYSKLIPSRSMGTDDVLPPEGVEGGEDYIDRNYY